MGLLFAIDVQGDDIRPVERDSIDNSKAEATREAVIYVTEDGTVDVFSE
jgi:hypothetical protein